MKLPYTLLKPLLLLMLLSNISLAQESCKGGFCKISFESLEKGANHKKINSSTKSKKVNKKNKVKFSSK